MNSFNTFVIIILSLNLNPGSTYKLIYQKDISEHCRRRVVPSIFLGRQVMEANARLMQFSRLELPYSCFISVRTESGSNMVMMIQVASDVLEKSCDKNREQLLVYEMGETFGGYWGPLPDSVLKWEPQKPRVYTLKTTQATTQTTKINAPEEENEEVESTEKTTTDSNDKRTGDYVEVEVPLLNVSVSMVPDQLGPQNSDVLDIDEVFDVRYDVTPVSGVPYETSILPLVQFHILKDPGERRQGDDEPPKYELDIVQQFTPDMRLPWPLLNPTSKTRKPQYKQRYSANRRLDFNKHRTLLDSQGYFDRQLTSQTITRRINYATKYDFPTLRAQSSEGDTEYSQDSWQAIQHLLEQLNKAQGKSTEATKTTLSEIDQIILEQISNKDHNRSASPQSREVVPTLLVAIDSTVRTSDLLKWDQNQIDIKSVPKSPTEITRTHIEDKTISLSSYHGTTNIESRTELYVKGIVTTKQTQVTSALHSINKSDNPMEHDNIIENIASTSKSVSETYFSSFHNETEIFSHSKKEDLHFGDKIKLATGSMVGHESWENVVQAAPEMAVLLNQTVAYDVTVTNRNDDVKMETEFNGTLHQNKLLNRKKREIHSVSIENARPYKLSTNREQVTTTKPSLVLADMQEFAQLVELKDDELHGRVALRYLRQYVGPALFNLCELADSGSRHVHLFNSSRIVLAISNFTLERMIVILTSARTLLSGEVRCPVSQLECQVSGARVCLDSMVACDGVPNCGSYDIYDEDRLLCGELANLKHNVYLAAFTVLAVLLTGLYAVHYWLKRCVPKVADAFFVYTNGVENILYLDSIMRSPNEAGDDMSKMVYQSHLFEDENIDYYASRVLNENACKRFLRKLCCCSFRKKEKKIDELEMFDSMRSSRSLSKRMYSFTELELRKMAPTSIDTAVQTGESLEMKFLETVKNKNIIPLIKKAQRGESVHQEYPIMIRDSSLTLDEPLPEEYKDELSLLKFLNDARNDTIVALNKPKKKVTENRKMDLANEKEIKSLAYDHNDNDQPGPSNERRPTTSNKSVPSSKHLRFDEVTTTIPSGEYDYEEDDDAGNVNPDNRRSIAFGESRPPWRSRHLDTIEEKEEHGGGAKEHRRFWGLPQSKAKKSRKKSNVSTLRH